jgi:membrane fusion protein (multidrug efflux system)
MMPPPRVDVETVHAQNVPLEVNYTATTEALKTVEVGATANGLLLNRFYTEGQFVEQGMVLFKINPEKYDAKAQQKKAELAEKQAMLRQAKRDWDRIFELRKEGAVSQNDRDEAVSALEIAEANVALAEAELNDAQLDVGYTNIKAPISGITGMENFSIGNIIVAGTSLTTITQLDPI